MSSAAYRRIRAPQADGAALVVPPLPEAAALVTANHQGRSARAASLTGRLPAGLFAAARRELLECALHHTGQYRDTHLPASLHADRPYVLSGHQPELFHPGVWFKNFLLSALGTQAGAVPINLIIDTDAVHAVGIKVPAAPQGHVQAPLVPFDAHGPVGVWEERTIVNREVFSSFPHRVINALASIVPSAAAEDLLVSRLWQSLPRLSSSGLLGLNLAQARHTLEAKIGLHTLEVPMSQVAQTTSFRHFAFALLSDASQLRATYNTALAEYRQQRKIRSHTHPVPALAREAGWEEVPLFIWTTTDPSRRPLFVQRHGTSLRLTDRGQLQLSLDASPDRAVEQLGAYEQQGIKIRPRALVTTMYARLLLSDVFVHGIGGAKYDELTDVILHRHFGVQPPAFITATATFRLPLPTPQVTAEQVRASQRRLRDLRFRPESFLDDSLLANETARRAALVELARTKREYLQSHTLRRGTPATYSGLSRLNLALNQLLEPVDAALQAQHAQLIDNAATTRLLGSREYSFVLFNSEILPARLLDLCKVLS